MPNILALAILFFLQEHFLIFFEKKYPSVAMTTRVLYGI
jgi:hypothetical protein